MIFAHYQRSAQFQKISKNPCRALDRGQTRVQLRPEQHGLPAVPRARPQRRPRGADDGRRRGGAHVRDLHRRLGQHQVGDQEEPLEAGRRRGAHPVHPERGRVPRLLGQVEQRHRLRGPRGRVAAVHQLHGQRDRADRVRGGLHRVGGHWVVADRAAERAGLYGFLRKCCVGLFEKNKNSLSL